MACKEIGARTLTRRLNPDSGPYTAALALVGMSAGDTWDLRFRFSLIDDGGTDCTADLYFEQSLDGGAWGEMSVGGAGPTVSGANPDTDYDRSFKPPVRGSWRYRVRVEYTDGPWYSSIGTAVVGGEPPVEALIESDAVKAGVEGDAVTAEIAGDAVVAGVASDAVTALVETDTLTTGIRGA